MIDINDYIKDGKLVKPSICRKCGGKMVDINDGLVYVCNNPKCKAKIISYAVPKAKEN